MQAIGSQVFLVLIPVAVILGLTAYAYRDKLRKAYVYVFGQDHAGADPVNRNPVFRQGQCSICLQDPKRFEVSATCGHSFCSQCLFSIYERTNEKVACPLCRKAITTMFKGFNADEEPAETRARMQTKIKQYNARFDDNRPLIRRLQEFPYVLRRAYRYMGDPRFWILFIKSLHFFRVIIIGIIYLLLPVDLLPERVLGFVGYIDDAVMFLTFALIGLAFFAPIFIRRQNHA